MKHEVKYQELNDEQLAMVAGGYDGGGNNYGDHGGRGGRDGGYSGHGDHGNNGGTNGGNISNTGIQGSPIALNINVVTQVTALSKNVSQNASVGQIAGATNNG